MTGTEVAGRPDAVRSRTAAINWGTSLLRSRLYPSVIRWPVLIFTAFVVVLSFSAPRHSEMNVGAALIWQVWWALLPFFVVLTARAWCAVCPFPFAGELARRVAVTHRPLPPVLVRRVGPWLSVGLLGLFGLAFLLLALEASGPQTGVLLLVFAAAAVLFALVWQGQAWCRYVCPVGLLLGLYSRLSLVRLEVAGSTREAAAAGARACQLFTSPVSSRRVHDCVLCSACMKVPEGDSVTVRAGRPSLQGQRLAPAEAVGVTMLLGLLAADALRMVPWYLRYMAGAVSNLHWSYQAALAAGVVGVVTVVLSLQAGLALFGGRREFWDRYSNLALALLPMVLAAQLSLSSQHLLAFGEVLRNLGAEASLLAPGHMPPADAYLVVWPAKVLQYALLIVGAGVAVKVARGGPVRGRGLRIGVVSAAAIGLLAVFAQPMSVAC